MSQRRCLWTPLGTQSPDPVSQYKGPLGVAREPLHWVAACQKTTTQRIRRAKTFETRSFASPALYAQAGLKLLSGFALALR